MIIWDYLSAGAGAATGRGVRRAVPAAAWSTAADPAGSDTGALKYGLKRKNEKR